MNNNPLFAYLFGMSLLTIIGAAAAWSLVKNLRAWREERSEAQAEAWLKDETDAWAAAIEQLEKAYNSPAFVKDGSESPNGGTHG